MFRDYDKADFGDCMNLVEKVWCFDDHFEPKKLATISRTLYTGGALLEGNFSKVIEEEEEIKGFIFGKINGFSGGPHRGGVRWKVMSSLLSLFFVRGVSFKSKKAYINNISVHEKNRREVEDRSENEVNLFVVDPDS